MEIRNRSGVSIATILPTTPITGPTNNTQKKDKQGAEVTHKTIPFFVYKYGDLGKDDVSSSIDT